MTTLKEAGRELTKQYKGTLQMGEMFEPCGNWTYINQTILLEFKSYLFDWLIENNSKNKYERYHLIS